MMIHSSKRCKYYIILVCAICRIKRNQITKMGIVVSTCSISSEYIDQFSLLVRSKIIEKCLIYLLLSL
jgi:hypothetical protein